MVMPATLTVSRCGAKARCATGLSGVNEAMTLGRPGSTVLKFNFGAERAEKIGDVFAHGLLAGLVGAGIALRIHARNRHQVLEEFDDVLRRGHVPF